MRDRVPYPGKENRVRIRQDGGKVIEGVLEYADDATQEGSAYTKGNVLPDDVCNLLGIDPDTSEPKDAWIGVITALGYSPVRIKVTTAAGNPMAGVSVSGLTGILPEYAVTDQNGIVFVILNEGDYTLSVPSVNCLDATISPVSVEVRANGNVQNVEIKQVSNGVTSKTFSSSGQFMLSDNVLSADVWALGGGGGGGAGGLVREVNGEVLAGGGGGGAGGRTSHRSGVKPTPFATYSASVGSGGSGGNARKSGTSSATGGNGSSGGSSSCTLGNVRASGGSGGKGGGYAEAIVKSYAGGDGGSGGSGGGAGGQMDDRRKYRGTAGADGGSSGGSGDSTTGTSSSGGTLTSTGGTGQNSSTGPFGSTNSSYAAGGGGGAAQGYSGASGGFVLSGGSPGSSTAGRGASWKKNNDAEAAGDATDGYGGGGGGGAGGQVKNDGSFHAWPSDGGDGGNGVVMVRWVNAS